MANLRRVEYEVGADTYARTVTLTLEPDSSGHMAWTIHVEAAGQRDESQTIRGLTGEAILEMAEVVKEKRANRGKNA